MHATLVLLPSVAVVEDWRKAHPEPNAIIEKQITVRIITARVLFRLDMRFRKHPFRRLVKDHLRGGSALISIQAIASIAATIANAAQSQREGFMS